MPRCLLLQTRQRGTLKGRHFQVKQYGFARAERLSGRSDFKKILADGSSYSSGFFRLKFIPSLIGYNRWAVVVDRKFGIAVERNRIKRRVREIIRTNKSLFAKSYDVLIFPKKDAKDVDYWRLKGKLFELFAQSGLIK